MRSNVIKCLTVSINLTILMNILVVKVSLYHVFFTTINVPKYMRKSFCKKVRGPRLQADPGLRVARSSILTYTIFLHELFYAKSQLAEYCFHLTYEGSEVFSAGFWVFWKLIRYQGNVSFQTECVRKEGVERSLYQPLRSYDYY